MPTSVLSDLLRARIRETAAEWPRLQPSCCRFVERESAQRANEVSVLTGGKFDFPMRVEPSLKSPSEARCPSLSQGFRLLRRLNQARAAGRLYQDCERRPSDRISISIPNRRRDNHR